MMNRYITALLVVLATTGIEAHTYQSALKYALTDITYEEFIKQPQAKALEEDVLAIIKAIKKAQENLPSVPNKLTSGTGNAPLMATSPSLTVPFTGRLSIDNPVSRHLANGYRSCIVIRGPNAC